ncbi:MAG: FlgO family outer membrane protein [Sulfuricellaceae bacterium]|nr:FlgO family outer membrane protein [Sulfuricellaceae bacterium]
MKTALPYILAGLLALSVTGCSTGPTYQSAVNSPYIQANYNGVEQLISSAKSLIGMQKPVVVATIVNVDSLTESSRFGRNVSEQISAKLAKMGYSVIELKLRDNIFIKQSEGELLLSREVREVSQSHKADTVVVGTYAEGRDYIYVNLKAVNVHDNLIVAAHDYALPLDDDTLKLLKPNRH